jgi:hypothetical protein
MRITSHTTVAIEPFRTSPPRVLDPKTTGSSSAGIAFKPIGLSTTPGDPETTDPFGSIFSRFSQAVGAAVPQIVTSSSTSTAATGTAAAATPTPTASTTASATPTAPAATVETGMAALVEAIQNGTFQATYVTDPSQLQATGPTGTDTMPSFYYSSEQTANQLAQLLGGTVVQMPAFGQAQGFSEPNANFIQLPNGMTFNASDVAYFARSGTPGGAQQLTADLTQTINQSSAWTSYYQNGGPMPTFPAGYIGPPISGLTYPPGTAIGADGNVINPSA